VFSHVMNIRMGRAVLFAASSRLGLSFLSWWPRTANDL
jgi:hypothetical protein